MQLNPYLFFNGNCAQAFKFYEHVLGGKEQFRMTYGQSPMCKDFPADMQDRIVHIRMLIGETPLMGADCPPDRFEKPQGVSMNIAVATETEAERVFKALSEGGSVTMAIQPTFWAARFGMCLDKFGIAWMVNCEHKPKS